jgi:MPBQ/MSBQ methyltransferase
MGAGDATERVAAHYGRAGLSEVILAALRTAGKDPATLTPIDLAPVDQFHIGGRDATLELARLAGLTTGARVLDVGGGLGGPARTLASAFGCDVTVLDLTEEYCRTGELLTARTGLGERVRFRHGSALAMPFADGSYDVAWTQHSSMNIADKERLYGEIRRVLRPGGRLALHEIMAGPHAPPHYPVPWAREHAISFLRPPAAIRALLAELGFNELTWVDVSTPAREWFAARVAALDRAPGAAFPPLGLHLLLGPEFAVMSRNMLRNLDEERIVVIEAVCERG